MLSNAGCLENFVQLVTNIAEGTMSCMNIAFLLCLDVAKLHSCITTTAMKFHHETKQVWEVVYKVCKGKGLHLFLGSKNRGCLQSKKMDGVVMILHCQTTILQCQMSKVWLIIVQISLI